MNNKKAFQLGASAFEILEKEFYDYFTFVGYEADNVRYLFGIDETFSTIKIPREELPYLSVMGLVEMIKADKVKYDKRSE